MIARSVRRCRSFGVGEVAAVDVLHGDVRQPLVLVHLVDLDDGRGGQARDEARFATEAGQQPAARGVQDLERHGSLERAVARQPHDTRRTAAEGTLESVFLRHARLFLAAERIRPEQVRLDGALGDSTRLAHASTRPPEPGTCHPSKVPERALAARVVPCSRPRCGRRSVTRRTGTRPRGSASSRPIARRSWPICARRARRRARRTTCAREVFVQCLGGVLGRADARGRFRALLSTVTRRALLQRLRRRSEPTSSDLDPAEPDPDFDREWTVALVERACQRMEAEGCPTTP